MEKKELELFQPNLNLLSDKLKATLEQNYDQVLVEVVDSSKVDLSQKPFRLSKKGLGGAPVICDVGGVDNLHYPENNEKQFEMKDIADNVGHSSADGTFFIGAGACDPKFVGVNSELIPNVSFSEKEIINLSVAAKLEENGEPKAFRYESTKLGLLANLLCSGGKQEGSLVHIRVSNRKENGVADVTKVIQAGLKTVSERGDMAIGLAGAVHVTNGRIHAHIMPDFPKKKMVTSHEVESWLKFFDFDTPVTLLSVIVSEDPLDQGLRLLHTHFFSLEQENVAGHYHYDLSPSTIYDGYFVVAQKLFHVEPAKIPSQN